MDQRRAEALTAIQRERAQVAQWVHDTRDEVARQTHTEITAAEETARRMIAEARDRVAELADVRGRIAAQLRGTQAQLGMALDDLAPDALPAASPAPAVEPAPRVRDLAPAPGTPALPAASGTNGWPAHDPAQAEAEPVTRPFHAVPAVPAETLVLDAPGDADRDPQPDTERPGPGEAAPDVTGPHSSGESRPDDARPDDTRPDDTRPDESQLPESQPEEAVPSGPAGSDEPEEAPDRPEPVAAEVRRPTQRRRKRQNSASRR
jgi:hypothetical protein